MSHRNVRSVIDSEKEMKTINIKLFNWFCKGNKTIYVYVECSVFLLILNSKRIESRNIYSSFNAKIVVETLETERETLYIKILINYKNDNQLRSFLLIEDKMYVNNGSESPKMTGPLKYTSSEFFDMERFNLVI